MKLGLHATQPQASLRIHFHLSCVRLDKVTKAIYFSNFKNWSTLSSYLSAHLTHLRQLQGVYQIREEIMTAQRGIFEDM